MSTIVGIDLGTTNSGVAIVREARPSMLPNGEERIIPSVVGYSSAGQWLVGTPARNQYVFDPENTVRSIKREMGTDKQVQLGGRRFTPQEISAFILRELKDIAERNLEEEITDAVITVPAYFSDAARQATRDAGQIAGLNVRRIINEPTAAALAYGLNLAEDQMVLVYDLGGGTFDVSLVELMGGIVEVRASHGNTRLGGDDFDQRLASWWPTSSRKSTALTCGRIAAPGHASSGRPRWPRSSCRSHPFAWIKEEYIAEKQGVPLAPGARGQPPRIRRSDRRPAATDAGLCRPGAQGRPGDVRRTQSRAPGRRLHAHPGGVGSGGQLSEDRAPNVH